MRVQKVENNEEKKLTEITPLLRYQHTGRKRKKKEKNNRRHRNRWRE